MKVKASNDCGGYQPPKGHLDTQLYPECKDTPCDRDIVKKTRKRRKNNKKAFNLFHHRLFKNAISDNGNNKMPGRGLPVVATRGALEKFEYNEIQQAMKKFFNADFGDICEEDLSSNMEALSFSEQNWMMGEYVINGNKLWIICDGSAVTALLPDEY